VGPNAPLTCAGPTCQVNASGIILNRRLTINRRFIYLLGTLLVLSLLVASSGTFAQSYRRLSVSGHPNVEDPSPFPPWDGEKPFCPSFAPIGHGSTGSTDPTIPIGPPGLSFRYVQRFGVTEQPYLADAQHLNGPRVCYALLALNVVSLGYDTKSLPK
jgi:hypothetical protein